MPEDQQARLVAAWLRTQHRDVDTGATRQRIQAKLDRLKMLFLEGDLTTEDYRTRKDALTAELASLPPSSTPDGNVGARLASYLADVSRAWKVATPEERNKIARALFASVLIEKKQAVACVPRPELESFFRSLAVNPVSESCKGGSDGDRSRMVELLTPRKIEIQDNCIRSGHTHATPSARYTQRPRKLTPDEERSVRFLAETKSLRSLAADFGVSHETVRSIVQDRGVRR